VSLDKAIKHGKEHRKPYRNSKRFDSTCRNHGSCSYCEGNRLHKHRRRKPIETHSTKPETTRLFYDRKNKKVGVESEKRLKWL
jgi:hypothetical protein